MTGIKAEPKFSKGDLVFGKVKGFPFWPARVEEVLLGGSKKPLYKLFFFGTYDRGVVKEEFVVSFNENEETLGVKSNRTNFGVGMEEIRTQPDLECPNQDPKLPESSEGSNLDADAGSSVEDWDNYDPHVVKAACGEYVNMAVAKSFKNVETDKCIQTLMTQIEIGNYLPENVQLRLQERQSLVLDAAVAAKKKMKFDFPESTREIDVEYLTMEKWLNQKFVEIDGILKKFREKNKIENKDTKETKCKQLTSALLEVVNEVINSEDLLFMSPLVLLKHPNIFQTIRNMDQELVGEDATLREDVEILYEKAAAVFGVKDKESFLKDFVARKKKFDKAINTLPVKKRLLLTHDPTCPGCKEYEAENVKIACFHGCILKDSDYGPCDAVE